MRILFGIQLTGNGHINRSQKLISKLRNNGHEVDVIVSGQGNSIEYNDFKFRFRGFTIFSNNRGGVNWIKTFFYSNPVRVLIESVKLNTNSYDLIISDFEPVSVWSSFLRRKKCISISNQNDILNSRSNPFISWIIRLFSIKSIRISYSYNTNHDNIYFPIISDEILNGKPYDSDHYLIYLPYLDLSKIYSELKKYGQGKWKVYHNSVLVSDSENIEICKIDKTEFTKDLISCKGIITAAGFSTTSEALIMRKKLWSIPLKGQFEQRLNADKLEELGVFTDNFNSHNINIWNNNYNSIIYKWQDQTCDIIKKIELYGKS